MVHKHRTMGLSILLVLALLVCATQPAMAQAPSPKPVLAEAPPPPGDEGAVPAAASAPALPDEETEAEAEEVNMEAAESVPSAAAPAAAPRDPLQWAPPPMVDTGGVGQASMAAFISDEQMLDSGGVLRAQGETLALGGGPGAIACPPGKVPVIYGGLSNTGCTPYYSLIPGVNNPIQDAHNNTLTTTGWWIWVTGNYYNPGMGSVIAKSVTVMGYPLSTTVTGAFALEYSSISLRELVVQDGRITSSGRSGTLRLHGVSVTGTFLDQYGIDITGHKGSILLTNANVRIYTGIGARLDASGGSGTVTVLNSAFNNNPNGDGLTIAANNAVRVENVSAVGNGKSAAGNGVNIQYRTRLTLKNVYTYDNALHGIMTQDTHPSLGGPVTLTNITASATDGMAGMRLFLPGPVSGTNLTANDNENDDGIQILAARGSITLSGVSATGNKGTGINLPSNAGAVSISNARFSDNGVGGFIVSKSSVAVRNAIIHNNAYDYGLTIDNSAAAVAAGVTLTNINASYNNGYGIQVKSKGTLTLSGISARRNGRAGAWLQTSGGGASVSSSYGSNAFEGNGTSTYCRMIADETCDGLYIDAKTSVSVSSTSASGNAWNGLEIQNASSARVSGSTANDNVFWGMRVLGKGSISLDRVSASNNTLYGGGIMLVNAAGTGSPSTTLNHVVTDFNNMGLSIDARGPVTLNHVSASYNSYDGIYVSNTTGTSGVTLTNSLGSDLVSSNGGINLGIYSRGAISVRGLNASGSAIGSGAYLNNSTSASSAGVSVSSSDFNGNGNDGSDFGLLVLSKGSISLSSVNASNNKGAGANLQNQFATLTGKTVSVSKGTFNNNGDTGVLIGSKSSVTLNNVIASGNHSWGATIDNYQGGAGTGNVTVSSSLGRNQFSSNGYDGLYIQTKGSVSVSNAKASNNGQAGVFSGIYIASYGSAKTATFTCVSAASNAHFGIRIYEPVGEMLPTLKGVWLGGNSTAPLGYTGLVTFYFGITCP